MPRSSLLRFILLALSLLAASAPARAQGLGDLFKNTPAPEEVQLETTLLRSREAFERTARRRAGGITDRGSEAQTAVTETLERFEDSAREALTDLELDGVLTLKEATDALQKIAEEELTRLDAALLAIREGHRPPPIRGDDQSWSEHVADLTRYTTLERNEGADWLRFLAWVLGGAFVGLVVSSLLGRFIRSRRSEVMRTLAKGVRVLVVCGFIEAGIGIGLPRIWLPAAFREAVSVSFQIILAVALFYFLWKLSGALALLTTQLGRRAIGDINEDVADLVSKAFRILGLFLFIFLVAEVFVGVDFGAFVAGLGVLGILATFALRDVIQNLAASFTIHSAHPFQLGSLVKFRDWMGYMETVGLRCTRIRTLQGHVVTLPNVTLIDEPVENLSARPYVRRMFRIGLTYDSGVSGVRRACEIIREIVDDPDWKKEGFDSHVVFEEIGTYALQILVDYRFASSDYWEAKANDSEVNLAILERLESEPGIEIAYPTSTVEIEREDEVAASRRGSGPGIETESSADGDPEVESRSVSGDVRDDADARPEGS